MIWVKLNCKEPRKMRHLRKREMKTQIVEQLGQADILLPLLISEGLAANDRIKARLSVLQAVGQHARSAGASRFDLADECRAAAIDPVAMEMLVQAAREVSGERVHARGLGDLISENIDAVAKRPTVRCHRGRELAGPPSLLAVADEVNEKVANVRFWHLAPQTV
jgi:hypothetical protein